MRVCAEPGCPTLVPSGRCIPHRRAKARARGTRQQCGYGAGHDRERARWAPRVARGTVKCWRCGKTIACGQQWDLGHDDHDRSRYRGPEHVACNRSAGGRAAHDRDVE